MRSIVPDLLWIGNTLDVRDVAAVLSLGIKAVVDLAANESPVQYPRDVAYCRLPLNDGAENDKAVLRLAVASTAEFIKARVPTLVACSAGMSRSPAVAAAAVALLQSRALDEVLKEIASSGPHDVAPALWSEIKTIAQSSLACTEAESAGVFLALLVLKTKQVKSLLSFYQALGVDFVEEQHGKGPQHHSGHLNGTVFEIYPVSDGESADVTTRLGLSVTSLAEVVEVLRSMGTLIVSEAKATEWVTRAVVRDPDGRAVELYQR